MDHHFTEFLGNYFIHATKYQKQADDILAWMNQGGSGSGFKEIASLFKQFYQVDDSASPDEFARVFQKFQKSYMELFSLPGMISDEKYQKLEEKYKNLKKKYDLQKETIAHLTSMTKMKDTVQDNFNQGIDNVMKHQKEIFENMVGSLNPKKE
jgi:chromosome segregation ATPase